MALWRTINTKVMRAAASTVLGAGVLAAAPALAEAYPGERWSVDLVRVDGADTAVQAGLRRATDRYFYGERRTRLEATAAGGALSVRIIDPRTGDVLIRQSGLAYDESGDIADSVTDAALRWMEGLSCVDDCRIAVSGPAPASQVQIAAAPAPVPQSETESPTTATPAPTASAAETAPAPTPEPVIAAVAPSTSASLAKPAASAAAASPTVRAASGGSAVRGLDADLVLAEARREKAARLRKPTQRTSSARPADTAVSAPTTPQAPSVSEPRPSNTSSLVAAAPAASAPAVADKPADTAVVNPVSEPTLSTPSPVKEPESVAAASRTEATLPTVKPEEKTAPAAPEITAEQPKPAEPQAPATTEQAASPQIATASDTDTTVAQPETPGTALPTAPQALTAGALTAAGASALSAAPSVDTTTASDTAAPEAPETPTVVAEQPAEQPIAEAPAAPASNDLDGEQLALANPAAPVTDPAVDAPRIPEPAEEQITQPADTETPGTDEPAATVETRVAAVDPEASGPTLANARWVGFTPAVFTGSDNRAGAWISGPFDRKERTGWITDTATGATTRVTFVWREGGSGGRTAILSREAAKALGLGQGDVANVAVYLPR